MPPLAGVLGADDTVEAPRQWWHDRPLLALLALMLAAAPFVTQRIYASDEIQYFAYTHSLFFDGDFDFSNEYLHFYESDREKFRDIYEDLYQKREPLTGRPINVAPVGTGLFWLPGYTLAHGLVSAARMAGADVAADGYSQPYIAAVCLSSYLFGCLGLLFTYLLCRDLFGRRVSAAVVAVMWLATPLVFYTVIAPPWSHATSLLTVSLFLLYWARTRKAGGRGLRQWLVLGVLAGLMMLVREQDALLLVIPFVEVMASFPWRRPSVAGGWVRRQGLGLLAAAVAAAVTFTPQLIAYREVTGRSQPSKIVSGKFDLTTPNFLNVLFSPQHGLITWTPVVALCLVGIALLWKRDRVMSAAFGTAFLLQVYIAGSFLTWQGAGSFGQRRFINSTAMFAVGLAMLASWLIARGIPKWIPAAAGAVLIAWNGGLLIQYALWCSSQRQGLDWAVVLRGQIESIWKVPSLVWDYITNREQFYRRTRC